MKINEHMICSRFKVHQLQSSVIRLLALLQIQDIMNESKDIDMNEITRVSTIGLDYRRNSTDGTIDGPIVGLDIQSKCTNEVKCLHIELTLDCNFILYIGQRSMLLTSMNEE